MNHGISQECSIGELQLLSELQKFLNREELPRKFIFGMGEHKKGWEPIDNICVLLGRLFSSKVRLDPSWRRPGWRCPELGFLLLDIPSRNELRGFGYSYWKERMIAAQLLGRFFSPDKLLFQKLINDPEADVRRIAAARLPIDLSPQIVKPYAIQALNDLDRNVRGLAVMTLRQAALEDSEVQERLSREIPLLLEMLSGAAADNTTQELQFHQAAAEILSMISRKHGDGRAAIIEALEGKRIDIRFFPLPILTGPGTADEKVVAFLERHLQSQDPGQRQWAAFHYWALGIDDGHLFRTVLQESPKIFDTRTLRISRETRFFFEQFPAERALPGLLSIVADSYNEPEMWCQAIDALAIIAAEEKYRELRPLLLSKIPLLIELLCHRDHLVVRSATKSLAALEADITEGVTALIQIVKDESQNLSKRYAVAGALAMFKLDPDIAVSLFEFLAEHNEHSLYSNAIPMISHLGAEAVPIVVKALQRRGEDGSIEFYAFKFLEQLGPAAVPGLVELSKTYSWNDRIIPLIGKTRSAETVPHLIDLLRHEKGGWRAKAAEALGRLGEIAAPAIPALSRQLTDPDLEAIVRAIEALGRIGRRAAPALIEAIDRIENADEFILCWLAKALGETKDGEAISCLRRYLSHPDPEVRYFVGEALRKLSRGGGARRDTISRIRLALTAPPVQPHHRRVGTAHSRLLHDFDCSIGGTIVPLHETKSTYKKRRRRRKEKYLRSLSCFKVDFVFYSCAT